MAQALGPIFGTGKDGYLTASGTQVVNTYVGLSSSCANGATSVAVDSITGFANGDLIMIHKTRGPTTTPGTWELNRIQGTPAGGSIPLQIPTINYYYESGYDQSQVVRVPEYLSVTVPSGQTIGCTGWNNSLGGITTFVCSGITTVVGSVSAAGKIGQKQSWGTNGDGGGFHGGGGFAKDVSGGPGIQGEGEYYTGGQSKSGNNSGGGAAQGTSLKGTAWLSDSSFSTRLGFGGGGGGGASDRGTGPTGGNGGGVVLIFSKILNVSGTITASGGNGYANGSNDWGDGGGGGGGSIFIKSLRASIGTNLVIANCGYGGTGGNGGKGAGGAGSANGVNGDGESGDGGVGRIRIESSSIVGTSYPTYTSLGAQVPWGGGVGVKG